MAITAKAAIEAASKAFREYYSEAPGVRLEEVRKSDDASRWLITLSFLFPTPPETAPPPPLLGLKGFGPPRPEYERVYRIFEIHAETGALIGMTLRTVA